MVGCRMYGRIGNALFQAAAVVGYALKHNLDFSLPNSTKDSFWNPLVLQHLVNPKWIQGKEDILINERHHHYHEIEFKEEWRDKQIVLNGYWQSWKHTDPYRNEILYLFDFPYEKKEGIVAVHVRRTDYLHLINKHPQYGAEWYERAMKEFDGYRFIFYSDDINWCRQNFGHRSDCEFSSNTDPILDLIEASCMEHSIISSSTFGWWIGWLNRNENKRVIIPEKWFVDGYNLLTHDIVPDYFTKLK